MKRELLEVLKDEPYKTKIFILDSIIFFTKNCGTRSDCREIKAQLYEDFQKIERVAIGKALDYCTGLPLV